MAGCLLFQNSFKLVARMILKVMEQQESAGKAYQIPAEKRLSFPQGDNIFHSRDPNSVPRRVKHFVKRNGLPDLSTHDILLSKRGGQKAAGAHSRAPVGLFCVKYALRLEMKRPI